MSKTFYEFLYTVDWLFVQLQFVGFDPFISKIPSVYYNSDLLTPTFTLIL